MGERALGIGLLLLSIALYVGPIVVAFGANGWDLKATVMPSQSEMDKVRDKIENVFGGEFSEPDIVDNTVNLTTGEFSVTFEFKSPFNLDVKITDVSLGFSCEQHDVPLGSAQMEEPEVDLPADGTARFTIVGTLTSEGRRHIEDFHGGDLPGIALTDEIFEFEVYGVTVRVEDMEGIK
ncbi:MAG: hypothetical protein U9M97_01395 [Candidatus Hadarchaeota archaeon]|nr:hypothetical protein [Candidatus Hadarchaeota archaeon]